MSAHGSPGHRSPGDRAPADAARSHSSPARPLPGNSAPAPGGPLADGGLAPVRVFLRPLGSPLTLGMSGLMIASLVQSGLELKWIGGSQIRYVGLVMIAVPFVLQITTCVFAYLARDAPAGASLGVLATTWLGLGLVETMPPADHRSGALGLLLFASGGMLATSASSVSRVKPLPGSVFMLSALRFVLTGAYQIGAGQPLREASGILGLAVTALAAYTVLAFELEDQRHALLPTFRRGRGRTAISGPLPDMLGDPLHDAGVRQTT